MITRIEVERTRDTSYWQEVDETGKIVAKGGTCLDPKCNCHKDWYAWKEESRNMEESIEEL